MAFVTLYDLLRSNQSDYQSRHTSCLFNQSNETNECCLILELPLPRWNSSVNDSANVNGNNLITWGLVSCLSLVIRSKLSLEKCVSQCLMHFCFDWNSLTASYWFDCASLTSSFFGLPLTKRWFKISWRSCTNLPPSMSLAIRAMSNAFPHELRLIIDIISGQYLFCRNKNNYMSDHIFQWQRRCGKLP